MTFRVTHLKRIAFVVGLAAAVTVIVSPTTAMAGRQETKQIAAYLDAVLNAPPTPAESGRAEAKAFAHFLRRSSPSSYPTAAESSRAETKQIAAYLGAVLNTPPTPAESGRAEAKAFAHFLRSSSPSSYPTAAESSRAETKAFANAMRTATTQPQVTGYGPSGFDWADAGIGAAAMLGIALLITGLGAGLVISRRHQQQHVPTA